MNVFMNKHNGLEQNINKIAWVRVDNVTVTGLLKLNA